MSHHPLPRKILHLLRTISLSALLVVGALLWLLDRGLPKCVCRRLEQELSKGVIATHFENASFNLFTGIHIQNAQMFIKHRLGPPLLHVDELRLRWKLFFDRPPATWIREITAKGLVCQAEFNFPEAPPSGGPPMDLAAYLRHLSVENDWTDEPVHFKLLDSTVFTVSFRELEFDAKIEDATIIASPLRISFESLGFEEKLEGQMSYDASGKELGGRLEGTLTPEVVRELTLLLDGANAVEYYDCLGDITSPFQVEAELKWLMEHEGRPVSAQDIQATVKGDDFTFNGLPVRHIDFGLHWRKDPVNGDEVRKVVTFDPMRCFLNEGMANVRAEWFPLEHKMDFIASANIFPTSYLPLLELDRPSFITNVVFTTPPVVRASGTVGMGPNREKLRVLLDVDDADCRVYDTPVQRFRTSCLLQGRDAMKITFPDFSANCYEGKIKGEANLAFSPGSEAPAFDISVNLQNVNCGKARGRAGINDAGDSKGRISGDIDLRGVADDSLADTLSGKANVKIRGGLLLRFPLFAGLTDFLGRNIPGVDFLLMQSDADIGATMTNGLAKIDNLSIEGNVFSLVAHGRCRYNTPQVPVEMVAQLRFFKQRTLAGRLARLMMLPASKFMEFRVTGPLQDASWNYIGLVDRILDWTFWPEKDATDLLDVPLGEAPIDPRAFEDFK